MFAHIDGLAFLQMQPENVSHPIAAEGDPSASLGFRHKDRHPREDALKGPFEALHAYFHRRVFPQKNVMFKVNTHRAQFDMKHWHQFPFDVICNARILFIQCRRAQKRWNSHKESSKKESQPEIKTGEEQLNKLDPPVKRPGMNTCLMPRLRQNLVQIRLHFLGPK